MSTTHHQLFDVNHLVKRIDPDQPDPSLTASISASPCTEELRAGLYLLNGDWTLAHETSQALDSPLAAHWHALVHRHEPDYANSKYWQRQAGNSPIYPELVTFVEQFAGSRRIILQGQWNPLLFTDVYAKSRAGDWPRKVDREEMRLLLAYSLGLNSNIP